MSVSNQVETKTVEMQFDSSKFVKGISESITALGNIEKKLASFARTVAIDSVAIVGAFSKITASSKEVKDNKTAFDGLGESVNTIADRFSNMGIIGTTALQNLTNKAVDAGTRIAKALTIDPVKSGFDEYELKMQSVQTIMASTGQDIETVNRYLNELNTYSDKTIYSFADMTNSIGKFTNAGVKLEDAVAAIQGIANEAAVSGANANEASRAMYNFAQALSSGAVKLIDWKSIENANMATVEFKEELMKTAVEVGTLVEKEGQYVSTTTNAQGKVSEAFTATSKFNDALSSQWMTTEVLTKTLQRYADENTAIGKKAFQAAQEVKTLSQLYDTMKESVQSSWSATWEAIIGDKNQAVDLLTPISKAFDSINSAMNDARNEALQFWNAHGGRAEVLEGFSNISKTVGLLIKNLKLGANRLDDWSVTASKSAITLVKLSRKFKNFTEGLTLDVNAQRNLRDFGQRIAETTRGIKEMLRQDFGALPEIFSGAAHVVGVLASAVAKLSAEFGRLILASIDWVREAWDGNPIRDFIQEVADILNSFELQLKGFNWQVDKPFALQKVFENLAVIISKVAKVFSTIFLTALKAVNPILQFMVDEFFSFANDGLGIIGFITDVGVSIATLTSNVVDFNSVGEKTKSLIDVISGVFSNIWGILKTIGETVKNTISEILGSFNITADDLPSIIDVITGALTAGILWEVLDSVRSWKDGLKGIFDEILGAFEKLKGASSTIDDILSTMDKVEETLGEWQETLKSARLVAIASSIMAIAEAMKILSSMSPEEMTTAASGLAVMLTELTVAMWAMNTALSKVKFDKKGIKVVNNSMRGIAKIAGGVLIAAAALKLLSTINEDDMARSLIAMTVVLTELGGMAVILGKLKMSDITKATSAMVTMAGAVAVMAVGLKLMGSMNMDEMLTALIGMTAVLGELVIFSRLTKKFKAKDAAGLLILAGAVSVIALALNALAFIKPEAMITAVMGLGTTLGIMVAALNSIKVDKGMLTKALAIGAVAGSLVAIAVSLNMIKGIGAADMIKSVLGLGVALAGIVAAVNLVPADAAVKAAGLVLMAGVIAILAASLKLLSTIPATDIAISAGVMVGAVLLLAGAVAILSKLTGPMVELAAGLVALGVGIAFVGGGMAAIGGGLLVIGMGLGAVTASMVLFLNMLVDQLPKGMNSLIDVIFATVVRLAEAPGEVLNAFGTLVSNLLKALADQFESVALSLCEGFAKALLAAAKSIGIVVDAAFQLIADFINAMADALGEKGPLILDALVNLIASIAKVALKFLLDFVPKLLIIGSQMIIAIGNGIAKYARFVYENLGGVIESVKKTLSNWVQHWKEMGGQLITGLVEGFKSKLEQAKSAIAGVGESVVNKFKSVLGIHSPSRVFKKLGENIVEGLILGIGTINAFKNTVDKDFRNFASVAIKALAKGLSGKYEYILKEFAGFYKAGNDYGRELVDTYVALFDHNVQTGYDRAARKIDDFTWKIYQQSDAYKESEAQMKEFGETLNDLHIKETEAQNKYEENNRRIETNNERRAKLLERLINASTDAERDAINKQIKYIDKETGKLIKQRDTLYTNWKDLEGQITDVKDNVVDLFAEMTDDAVAAFQTFDTEIREAVAGSVEMFGASMGDLYSSMFEQYKNPDALATDDILNNMQSQVEGVKLYQDNLVALKTRMVDELGYDRAFYDQIASMGEAYVNAFLSMTDEDIARASGYFDQLTQLSTEQYISELDSQVEATRNWSKNIVQLSNQGISQGLLMELAKLGPEGSAYVDAFVKSSTTQLQTIQGLFESMPDVIDKSSLAVEAAIINAGDGQSIFGFYGDKIAESLSAIAPGGTVNETIAETVENVADSITQTFSVSLTSPERLKTLSDAGDDMGGVTLGSIQSYLNEPAGVSVAANVCKGLSDGLLAGQSGVISAAVSVAVSALEAAKTALDINSPSKKFAEIGIFADKGFALGLRKGVSEVEAGSEFAGNSALDKLRTAFSNMNDILNGELELNPVISPVLDVSSIRKGAQSVNSMFGGSTFAPSFASDNAPAFGGGATYNFTQNNYSPKALSRIDIYRQTKNQFSMIQGV